MKIYNKKTFFVGVYFIVMAVGLVVLCFLKEFKPYDLILAGFCALIGLPFLLRSLSYEKSRKDKLEEREERNRFIALQSNSKSHQLTQIGCSVIMVLFFAMSRISGSAYFVGIGIGAAFCLTVSLFAEMFTKIYYEKRS